jgi:hypothetical protein
MATETDYLSGVGYWCKVHKPDAKYGNYVIDFYPDKASEKLMKDVGIQVTAKESEHGRYYRLRREAEGVVKGEAVAYGPPKVVIGTGKKNENGVEITEDTKKLIGNGSEITVKVSVYDTRKGKGHRMEAIRVDKLVEFVPSERPATEEYPF